MKHKADGSVANLSTRYRRRPRSIPNRYYVALRLVGLTLLIALAASYAQSTWAATLSDMTDKRLKPAPLSDDGRSQVEIAVGDRLFDLGAAANLRSAVWYHFK
jgi:hypothetical protein